MSRFTTLVSLALLASTVVAQGGIGQLYSSSPLISGVGTLGINQPGQALVDAESVINVLGPFGCAKNYVIGVNSTLDAGKLVHACLCLEVLNSADNACPTCQPHAQPICGAANGCGCKCEVGYVATSDGTCVPDTVCTSPNKIDSSGPGSPTCACAVGSIPGPSLTGGCIIITPSSSMPPPPSSSSVRPSSSVPPPASSSSVRSSSSVPPPAPSSSSSSIPPPAPSSSMSYPSEPPVVPSSSMPTPSSSMPPVTPPPVPSSSMTPVTTTTTITFPSEPPVTLPTPVFSSASTSSSSSSMPPVTTTTTITFPSEPPMTLPTPVFSSTSTSSSSSSSFCATLTITLTKTKTVYEPTLTYFSPIPWTTLYSTYTPPGTTTTTTSSAMSSVTPAPSSSMSVSSVTTTSPSIVTESWFTSSSMSSFTSVPPTTSSSVPAMTTTMSSLPPCATLGRRQRRSGGSVIGNLVNNGTFTGGFLCAYGDAGPIGLEGSGYGELQPTPTAVVIPHVTFCMTMGESACPQSDGSFTCYNTQTSSAACGGCIGQGGVVCSASQKCVNSTCQ